MTKEIKKVMNLDNPIPEDSLNGYLFSNENKGHKFIISCTKGGELQTLTGSVTVRFMRANNTTILLGQGGSDGRENYAQVVDGNAEVTLHPDCYNVPGRFKISVFNISGDTVSCIYVGVGTVSRTQNGELIDSGEIVPSIDELVGYIDDCIEATRDAEAVADHAVRYDVAQTLTDTQKAQARTNIDASSQSDVDDLKSAFNEGSFPTRTDNILDWQKSTILNYFYNTSGQKLRKSDDCRAVLIPVNVENGDKVTILKNVLGTFAYVCLPFDDPAQIVDKLDVAAYTKHKSEPSLYSQTITIDSSVKSIFLWYYYSAVDTGLNPYTILSNIMVVYGNDVAYFEPSRGTNSYKHISTPLGDCGIKDFNDKRMIVRNCSVWLASTNNALLNTPDGDNVNGYWVLVNQLFRDLPTSIFALQTAISYNHNDSGTLRHADVFYRYILYNPSTDTFDTINAWKPNFPFEQLEEFVKAQDVTDAINGALDDDTTDSILPWAGYGDTNKANAAVYYNDYIYHQGFVKSIKTKINSDSTTTARAYIIHQITGVVLGVYSAEGTGVIEIPVNQYIGCPFLLGICGENASFVSGKYSALHIKFKTANPNNVSIGNAINVNFGDVADNTTVYSLAQQVVYSSLNATSNEERDVYTHKSMFAVGDSITAGHPAYTEGIHWWETVARTLGYNVTPGGRSGAGISYYNELNGCKVAHNTDFSQYNVAVFAFGTNDYGNDIPLGSFADEYTYSLDSSQTFYACLKYIIQTVKTSNPKCTLIFSLPINRTKRTIADDTTGDQNCGDISTKWAYNFANNAGFTLNDYCEAIIYCCNYYGVPYIDHRNGAFDSYALNTLLVDGLHPTDDGYKILGQEMSAKLGAILLPYAEYSGVGGIGRW